MRGPVWIALLVAEMRASMRRPWIFRVLGEGALDLRAGSVALSVFRQRHAVMGSEPPIIAVARGQPVQQFQQHAFLPGAAGTADQPVGEGSGAKHHGVARPTFKCTSNAESAASASPATSKSKKAIWLASRADRSAARELAAAIDARAAAASPRSSSACALAAWASAKSGLRRSRDRRPRSRRDTWSASPGSPPHRRPAPRRMRWTRGARIGRSA